MFFFDVQKTSVMTQTSIAVRRKLKMQQDIGFMVYTNLSAILTLINLLKR